MEEDILYEFRNIVEESRIEDNTDYYIKLRDTLDFIENLLTRYKQLEEKETEKFLKVLEDNSKTMLVKEVMELRTELQNSIPKSKVKEKIEELKEQYEDYSSKWEKSGRDKAHPFYRYLVRIEAEIDILQELLES